MILVPDALGDTPTVGTGQAGAVDNHREDLVADVQDVGGFLLETRKTHPRKRMLVMEAIVWDRRIRCG